MRFYCVQNRGTRHAASIVITFVYIEHVNLGFSSSGFNWSLCLPRGQLDE